jgi:hypothetical protein
MTDRQAVWDRETERQRAALQALRQALGTTPREWLTWLLDNVAYTPDVRTQPAADQSFLAHVLPMVISDATRHDWVADDLERETVRRYSSRDAERGPWSQLAVRGRILLEDFRRSKAEAVIQVTRLAKAAIDALAEAQRGVRDTVEALARDRLFVRPITARLRVARRPPFSPHAHPPLYRAERTGQVSMMWQASLPDATVVATLSLLNQIPTSLLRRCPYSPPDRQGRECGRVFVGIRSAVGSKNPVGATLALDASDGKVLWRRKNIFPGLPLVSDGQVVACPMDGRDQCCHLLDAKNGETIWSSPPGISRYQVTLRRPGDPDPLYAVDLSDASDPRITGEVEVFEASSGRLLYTSPPEHSTFTWTAARELKLGALEIHLSKR